MKRAKQIAAIIGALLLAALYILTLVFALMKRSDWFQWFQASIFCTVAVPVLIYGMQLLCRVLKKKSD